MTDQQQFGITIPGSSHQTVDLAVGEVLFVVGANGSGKSALLQSIYLAQAGLRRTVKRVSADRQGWMESSAISITATQAEQVERNRKSQDLQPNARHREPQAAERVNKILYDLSVAENKRNKAIAGLFTAGNIGAATQAKEVPSPAESFNRLLKESGFQVTIDFDGERFDAKREGANFSADQMSNGERAAFLLAGEVLTAPDDSLVLLDEPEIHLHPSISAALLRSLFLLRNDCAFAVFTHDLGLPGHNSRVLVLRSCDFDTNGKACAFHADILEPGDELPESVRRDILGARERVLFIEGESDSLDVRLYKSLFPDVTVVPKGGCQEVRKAVTAVRDAKALLWLHAAGIVDNDGMPEGEVDELRGKNVFPLDFAAIESIYYGVDARLAVADGNAVLLEKAAHAGLDAVQNVCDKLSRPKAKQRVRKLLFEQLPASDRFDGVMPTIILNPGPIFESVKKELDDLIAQEDLDKIISRFSIKDGTIRKAIATELGFDNPRDYEDAVAKAAISNETFRQTLLERLASVRAALGGGGSSQAMPVEALANALQS